MSNETVARQKAISKHNVLNKMCFVQFGSGLQVHQAEFRSALLDHLARRGDRIISRQTIMYWFSKNSLPTRTPAFEFLKDFLETQFDLSSMSADQRKVHTQCLTFLSASIRSSSSNHSRKVVPSGILASSNSNILLMNSLSVEDLERFSESWQGIYVTYRHRLIFDENRPVSREVVRLFRRNRDLIYQHWHLREGVSLDRFEGLIAPKPHSVWMYGANKDDTRYRICHFRANNTINPVHRRARWGLMHSDVPLSSSHEPASTRIIMFLNRHKVEDFDAFVRNTVRYIDYDEIDKTIKSVIDRAIDNKVSCTSEVGSIKPTGTGDQVLQVDQRTLESICSQYPS